MTAKANMVLILIGAVALLLGSLVYLVDRPPEHTYFVYASKINISLFDKVPNLFGAVGHSLPAFLHVFSFILITAALLSPQKSGCFVVCFSWVFIDSFFELSQKYSALTLKIMPNWFSDIPFLENSANYFRNGTFDIFDLAAITLGGIIAYFVLTISRRRIIP